MPQHAAFAAISLLEMRIMRGMIKTLTFVEIWEYNRSIFCPAL